MSVRNMADSVTASEAEPLVRIRDLRYRYPGSEMDALQIPSLDIRGGGLIALTGLSGAGKTTLVELIAGTLRESYEGSLRVLGQEWRELRRDADRQRLLRRIGLIPQDYGLLPALTPRQTILQDLADAGVSASERNERAERSLGEIKLDGFADRPIAHLSGGQRQRVAIARMLAREVELVIADEPTANLDRGLTEQTIALLSNIASTAPVLIVTHDPHVAELCDRTIVLQGLAAESPSLAPVIRRPRRTGTLSVLLSSIAILLAVVTGTTVILARSHAHATSGAARATSHGEALSPSTAGSTAGPVHTASTSQRPSTGSTSTQGGEEFLAPGAQSNAEVRARLGHFHAIESAARAQAQSTVATVPGGGSIGGAGQIPIPAGIPEVVQRVIAGANAIADSPDVVGSGHGQSFADTAYDSSGSISYALAAGGLLREPETSGELESWGEPGPGRWITVYTNPVHTYMYVNVGGRWMRYDTVGRSGPYASRWQPEIRSNSGFVARHPPGL